MSSDVSNARGGKKAARREKNGEESAKIPRGLRPRGDSGSAAKAPAKEIPQAAHAICSRA